jgi:hypothetical protein
MNTRFRPPLLLSSIALPAAAGFALSACSGSPVLFRSPAPLVSPAPAQPAAPAPAEPGARRTDLLRLSAGFAVHGTDWVAYPSDLPCLAWTIVPTRYFAEGQGAVVYDYPLSPDGPTLARSTYSFTLANGSLGTGGWEALQAAVAAEIQSRKEAGDPDYLNCPSPAQPALESDPEGYRISAGPLLAAHPEWGARIDLRVAQGDPRAGDPALGANEVLLGLDATNPGAEPGISARLAGIEDGLLAIRVWYRASARDLHGRLEIAPEALSELSASVQSLRCMATPGAHEPSLEALSLALLGRAPADISCHALRRTSVEPLLRFGLAVPAIPPGLTAPLCLADEPVSRCASLVELPVDLGLRVELLAHWLEAGYVRTTDADSREIRLVPSQSAAHEPSRPATFPGPEGMTLGLPAKVSAQATSDPALTSARLECARAHYDSQLAASPDPAATGYVLPIAPACASIPR